MEVIVYHGQERRAFGDVSGIVISEIRQHCDLYPRFAPIVRFEPEEWTRLEIQREPTHATQQDQEPEGPKRRNAALTDFATRT